MNADVLEHLKSLHTNAIDARNGYQEALRDAEGKGFTSLFEQMISIHTNNAGELATEIAKSGEPTANDGSFMSTIHRTIMSIRSLFGGLDESVLPGLIDGEQRNVSAYRKAIESPDVPPAVRTLLQTQCTRLEEAIVRMQASKD